LWSVWNAGWQFYDTEVRMHAFAALWYVCCSRSSGYCCRETVTTVDVVALLPFLLLMCCLSSSSHIPQLLQGISGFLTRPWTPAATQMGLTWRMRNGSPIMNSGLGMRRVLFIYRRHAVPLVFIDLSEIHQPHQLAIWAGSSVDIAQIKLSNGDFCFSVSGLI